MAKLESIVLGGGCFWCLEAAYQLIDGVKKVTSGYAGGHTKNPTYFEVAGKQTGHAEVVEVVFDTDVITLEDVLDIFWVIHDPTTLNRQGYDEGPEYRSIILYSDEEQKKIIHASIKQAQELWDEPIITEVAELSTFYEAEPEHQNYFKNNPERAYCQIIINPKLKKLREKYASRIKTS